MCEVAAGLAGDADFSTGDVKAIVEASVTSAPCCKVNAHVSG